MAAIIQLCAFTARGFWNKGCVCFVPIVNGKLWWRGAKRTCLVSGKCPTCAVWGLELQLGVHLSAPQPTGGKAELMFLLVEKLPGPLGEAAQPGAGQTGQDRPQN